MREQIRLQEQNKLLSDGGEEFLGIVGGEVGIVKGTGHPMGGLSSHQSHHHMSQNIAATSVLARPDFDGCPKFRDTSPAPRLAGPLWDGGVSFQMSLTLCGDADRKLLHVQKDGSGWGEPCCKGGPRQINSERLAVTSYGESNERSFVPLQHGTDSIHPLPLDIHPVNSNDHVSALQIKLTHI